MTFKSRPITTLHEMVSTHEYVTNFTRSREVPKVTPEEPTEVGEVGEKEADLYKQ